jgi:hypothetical protein
MSHVATPASYARADSIGELRKMDRVAVSGPPADTTRPVPLPPPLPLIPLLVALVSPPAKLFVCKL